jgi:hypothetical protein
MGILCLQKEAVSMTLTKNPKVLALYPSIAIKSMGIHFGSQYPLYPSVAESMGIRYESDSGMAPNQRITPTESPLYQWGRQQNGHSICFVVSVQDSHRSVPIG